MIYEKQEEIPGKEGSTGIQEVVAGTPLIRLRVHRIACLNMLRFKRCICMDLKDFLHRNEFISDPFRMQSNSKEEELEKLKVKGEGGLKYPRCIQVYSGPWEIRKIASRMVRTARHGNPDNIFYISFTNEEHWRNSIKWYHSQNTGLQYRSEELNIRVTTPSRY